MSTNDPSPFSNSVVNEPAILSESAPIQQPVQTPNQTNQAWWSLFKAFLAWVLSVICLLIVPLILVVPYLVYLSMSGAGFDATPEILMKDKTFIFLSILGVIPAHLLTLFAAWALQTNFGKIPFFQSLRMSWPPSISPWLAVVLCGGGALVLLGIGVLVTIFVGGGKTDLDMLVESSFQARLATVALAVFTAPLVEEIIYRGMLYPAIQRVLGLGGAVFIVTVLFAGVHVYQYRTNVGVIIVITMLSLTLTLVRALTDRLLPSVVIHLIFNGIQALMLLLQPFIEKPKVTPPPAVPALIEFIRHLI